MKTTIYAALAVLGLTFVPATSSAVTKGGVTATLVTFAHQSVGLTDLELEPFGAYAFGGTWSAGDPTVTPPPASLANTFMSPFSGSAPNGTFADDPDGGSVVGEKDKQYFSVGGSDATNGSVSPNTLTLGAERKSIRLLWGSIDDYNSLTFGGGSVGAGAVFDGTTIAVDLLGVEAPIEGNPEYVAIIDFMVDAGTFSTLTFSSEGVGGGDIPAMEFATVIPVPFGALLIGTAFFAAGAVRRFGRKAGA